MQSIIINFYSIIDFHFKFCQVDRRISNYIENYSELPHQLEKSGDFLPDRKCHGKQSNNILKASWSQVPCMQGNYLILLSLLVSQTEENFPPWDLNISFWKLLINCDYDKFCRTGLPYVFIMPRTVNYRGRPLLLSWLITHDYNLLFSVHGHPLLQTLVCKADWQYHGSATLTVEYILLTLLIQYFGFSKFFQSLQI